MGRLIDADVAIDAPNTQAEEMSHWSERYQEQRRGVLTAVNIVADCPSAQPEPESISEWKKEFREYVDSLDIARDDWKGIIEYIDELPSAQPERKTGHWILDRSGAYCCNRCMEPCASYVMMKPRDKFCKMCGSRNEVTE